MKTSFALTTRQAAKLAAVESHVIYSHVSRFGNWRGVKPRKLPNGRLLWRADEVHGALGLIPDEADMSLGERAWVDFVESRGFMLTADRFEVGQVLLSHSPDRASDPAEFAQNESDLLVGLILAWTDRVDGRWASMGDKDRMRVQKAATLIAASVAAFDGSYGESEVNHG